MISILKMKALSMKQAWPLGVAAAIPAVNNFKEWLDQVASYSGTLASILAGPIALVTLFHLLRKKAADD